MTTDPVQVSPAGRSGSAAPNPGADRSGATGHAASETRRGFSIIEAVIALVLLGIAASGVLLPFSHGAAAEAEGQRLMLAARLADDLMEQVLATPFDQIVALGDGYVSVEPEGQVADALGVQLTDPMYACYGRDLTYRYACPYPVEWKLPPDFVLATVQVYYRGRKVATLNRLIGR